MSRAILSFACEPRTSKEKSKLQVDTFLCVQQAQIRLCCLWIGCRKIYWVEKRKIIKSLGRGLSSQLRKEAVERRDRTLKHGAFFLKEYVKQERKRRKLCLWKSSREEVNVLTERDWERLKGQSGETSLEEYWSENLMPCNVSPAKSLLGRWFGGSWSGRSLNFCWISHWWMLCLWCLPLDFMFGKNLDLASGLTFLLC